MSLIDLFHHYQSSLATFQTPAASFTVSYNGSLQPACLTTLHRDECRGPLIRAHVYYITGVCFKVSGSNPGKVAILAYLIPYVFVLIFTYILAYTFVLFCALFVHNLLKIWDKLTGILRRIHIHLHQRLRHDLRSSQARTAKHYQLQRGYHSLRQLFK